MGTDNCIGDCSGAFVSLAGVEGKKKKLKKEALLIRPHALPAGIGFLATLCPLTMKL